MKPLDLNTKDRVLGVRASEGHLRNQAALLSAQRFIRNLVQVEAGTFSLFGWLEQQGVRTELIYLSRLYPDA